MAEQLLPIYVIIVAAAVTAVFYRAAVHKRRERERRAAMRQYAGDLGWGFKEAVEFDGLPGLERFHLFTIGRSRTLFNIMTSPAGEQRIVVFDYIYITGGGKAPTHHQQTVCHVTSDQLSLPTFKLVPENLLHRMVKPLGYRDIDVDGHPEFSRSFVLRGGDEAALRRAFTDDVAVFFEQREGTSCEGADHELLLWHEGAMLQPAERQALIDECLALAGLFTTHTSAASQDH